MNYDRIGSGNKSHQPLSKILRWGFSFLFLLVLTYLAGCARPQLEVEIQHFTTEDGEQAYKVKIAAPKKCRVFFENEEIHLDENLLGEFIVSSHELKKGPNDLTLICKKKDREWEFPFTIESEYDPILFSEEHNVKGDPGSDWRIEYEIVTSPGVGVLLLMGADTLLDTLTENGEINYTLDIASRFADVDPDETPDSTLIVPLRLTSSDNVRTEEIATVGSFPRLELVCDYPSSKTGSSLEIKGSTAPGARINLIALDEDGNETRTWSCRALTQSIGSPKRDRYGLEIPSTGAGDFVIYGSLSSFGENVFKIVASKPYCVSAVKTITIEREMTDSERRQEYYRTAIRVTAKELATNHSYYIGKRVIVWGRTVEYFNSTDIHCVSGGYHWAADLSGFTEIPNLVGSSFSVAGVVTDRSYDFTTRSGKEVHAPLIDAVYFTLGY